MSTVDEIIQNLIAKQDANDALARTDRLNKAELYSHIKQIENKKANQMGNGTFKNVYPFKGDKVILAGLLHKNDFDHRQQIIDQLIECGINTPRLIFHTTKGNHNYEVQERAKGSFLRTNYYHYILDHLSGLSGKTLKIESEDERALKHKYNFEMIKRRTLTGIPHIEKFLIDFTCLKAVGALDILPRNFFYDPKTGYSFIDLNVSDFSKNIKNMKDYLNSKVNSSSEFKNATGYADFIFECIASDDGYRYNFFNNNLHFGEYVYSGILLKQFLNVMQTSTHPHLKFAKSFAENFDFDCITSASPKTLELLYSGIKTNDETIFKYLRKEFGLPASYDFSKELDGESFIKAMDLTYAMEQPKEATENTDIAEME